jgi:hypothetical protein
VEDAAAHAGIASGADDELADAVAVVRTGP